MLQESGSVSLASGGFELASVERIRHRPWAVPVFVASVPLRSLTRDAAALTALVWLRRADR